MLGCEVGIKAGCELELLVETGKEDLGFTSDSFMAIVVVTDVVISALLEFEWSGLSGSKADLGLSFPITSLTVLLCIGRGSMFCLPVLSSNWLREVGVDL